MLIVEDEGVGIDSGLAPRSTGFGTRVVSAMAKSLRSAIVDDPAHKGVRATLRAALGRRS
ncbi:MAG: hypothetical protein K2P79_14350 [Sphingomonas sp.]|nr:hypothetical protein [Sphingomonas sp.]